MDPFVKCFLFKSYCLSLYGCSLWSLSSSSIKLCEVALKKSLRKLWHLPYNSHSTIVHCVAQIDTISAIVLRRFLSLLSSALSSSSSLVQSIFSVSSSSVFIHLLVIIMFMVLIISLIIHTLIYLLPTRFVEFDIVMVVTPHVKI